METDTNTDEQIFSERELYYQPIIRSDFDNTTQPYFTQFKCKRSKRRYYPLGLIAKIANDTSDEELRLLFKHGVRSFIIDTVAGTGEQIAYILKKLSYAIEEFDFIWSQLLKTTFNIGFVLIGDNLRLGRLHNNSSVFVERNDVITLTPDTDYVLTGTKEILFVFNLLHFIKRLNLYDKITIGKDIQCLVIKKLTGNIAVLVTKGGLLNSYDYINFPNRCYKLPKVIAQEMAIRDLKELKNMDLNMIVLPKVRNKDYLLSLRENMNVVDKYEILGAIDLEYIVKFVHYELIALIQLLDYIWIPDYFNETQEMRNYIDTTLIPILKGFQKPIIGTVPLEKCSDFKRFENNNFLFKIDTILIQKSSWCNKYPLIVKKLVPVRNFRKDHLENFEAIKEIQTTYEAAVNFIIRTISSIECRVIIIYSKSRKVPVAFARPEIYCPVYVMLPKKFDIDEYKKDPSYGIDVVINHLEGCAREFHLRRNLESIYYNAEDQHCTPIEYGIYFGRQYGLLDTGDFIITMVIGRENENKIEFDIEGNIALIRAIYLPPPRIAKKFKYA